MKKRTAYIKNQKIETREIEGKKFIRGIIPYNSVSTMLNETIAPSAFVKSLQEQDIKALVNHNTDMVLGSTRSGTLVLDNQDDGLYFEVNIGNQQFAQDAFETVSRGDASGVSFGFAPVKIERSGLQSVLKEVKLFEISPVCAFPAYEESEAITVTRDMFSAIKEKRGIDLEAFAAVLSKDNLDETDITQLTQLRDEINNLIPKHEEQKPAAEPEPSADTQEKEALANLELELEIENAF